jgi:dipeptidyl aminopeptidase/acylaminoacyl peptidase
MVAVVASLATAAGVGGDATRATVRTLAVTGDPIVGLAPDGATLVWGTSGRGLAFFDPATRKVTSRWEDFSSDSWYWGAAFAGRRSVFATDEGDGVYADVNVWTAGPAEARPRRLAEFRADLIDEADDAGAIFSPASDGRTVVFFGAGWTSTTCGRNCFCDPGCTWGKGVWRLSGRRTERVPNQRRVLAGLGVFGDRLATLGWTPACRCDESPAWSPDGREVAWVHAKRLWLTGADGRGRRELSTTDVDSPPRWSPDGSTLAFESGGSVTSIDRSGANLRSVVVGQRPAWAPDGKLLAFNRGMELWIVNADGGSEKLLAPNAVGPDWSPDGRWIAYMQRFGPGRDDYRTAIVSATEPSDSGRLTPDPQCKGTAWSPGGRTMAGTCDSVGLWAFSLYGDGHRLLGAPESHAALEVRTLRSGRLVRRWEVPIFRDTREASIAFTGGYVVVREQRGTFTAPRWVVHRYDVASGRSLGEQALASTAGALSASGRWAVYAVGRRIVLLDVKSGRSSTLANARSTPVGPMILGKRVFWAERWRGGSRVREVVVG